MAMLIRRLFAISALLTLAFSSMPLSASSISEEIPSYVYFRWVNGNIEDSSQYKQYDDGIATNFSVTTEHSQREGYKVIVFSELLSLDYFVEYDGSISYFTHAVFDKYSGVAMPIRAEDVDENGISSIKIDYSNKTAEIICKREVEIHQGEIYKDDLGNECNNTTLWMTFSFDVPNDYDGLFYTIFDVTSPEQEAIIPRTVNDISKFEGCTSFYLHN